MIDAIQGYINDSAQFLVVFLMSKNADSDNTKKDVTESHAHPVDLHVGMRVRVRRKHLGLSQSDLAETLGLTFQQVQKYERGANRISASMLLMISRTLRAPVAYFFEGLGELDAPEETSESEGAINRFMHLTEGAEMARLFPRISKPSVKKRLMELIRSLAD